MIWSIIPTELIFDVNSPERVRQVAYAGRTLTLRADRVEALSSSDPQDFLDPRFQPGSTLPLR